VVYSGGEVYLPRTKYALVRKKTPGLLMLYIEMVAVFSEIPITNINILCEQNVEFLNVNPGGV